MKQKFRKLTFVNVSKDMPSYMSHFDNGFQGIVDATYSQHYGGSDIEHYSVYKIEDGKVCDKIAWYEENQLTAREEQDSLKAEEMIEAYNLGEEGGE